MELEEIMRRISEEKGAVRVEVMPDELGVVVVDEEATVTAAGGAVGVRNVGLDDFMAKDTHLVAFVKWDFKCPDATTMRMVDEEGNVLGHDIPACDIPLYSDRTDVSFLSEDFVMYNDVVAVGDTAMEMLAPAYGGTGDWMPEDVGAVIWFSSTTSSELIHTYFDQPVDDLATAMIGLNLKR